MQEPAIIAHESTADQAIIQEPPGAATSASEQDVTEKNKALALRFKNEAYNKGNLDVIDELVATDHQWHGPGNPAGMGSSPEDLKRWILMLRSAFPDIHFSVDEIVAEGDIVSARGLTQGTHTGEFMGMPPTGNRISIYGIQVNRITDGKITDTWAVLDAMALMQQLGINFPAQGQSDSPLTKLVFDTLGLLQHLSADISQSIKGNGNPK